MKRSWTIIGSVILSAMVLSLVTAEPASATTISFSFEDFKHKDNLPYIGAACPSGEGFLSGTATFYQKPYMQGAVLAVVEGVVNLDDWPHGMFAPVPKQARSVSVTFTCVPTGAPVVITGIFTSEDFVTVGCPADSPYLVSIGQPIVDSDGDFTTTQDQYQPFYIQIRGGIQFQGPIGAAWQVTHVCSSTQQIGT